MNSVEDDKPARHMQTRMIVIMFKKEAMAFQDPCLPYFVGTASYCLILITGIRFEKN